MWTDFEIDIGAFDSYEDRDMGVAVLVPGDEYYAQVKIAGANGYAHFVSGLSIKVDD
jgi:hypothetical protein